MLKKRIIPVQLLLNGRLVKTQEFGSWRDVGDPVASSRVYNSQQADELVFLNISRDNRQIEPLIALIEKVSAVCFMPLSLGGGIRNAGDAEKLIRNGADKVVLNSAAYQDPKIISQIARKFGAQAVVVSIDVKRENGVFQLYSDCGRQAQATTLKDHIARCLEAGAGEFFVNSIDRDGTMLGYDLELISNAVKFSRAPVIGCGGAGSFEHMKDAFLLTGANALACGSLFNFGDNNPLRAKAFLTNYGLPFKKV
jgi:cyclase